MAFEVPNLTLLHQFVITAEEQGISKAARRLRISQPALSKNIRKLEDILGTRLFDRSSDGATLTETGQIFFDRAQTIGLEYQHALEDIHSFLSDQKTTIRIGVGPVWSSTILPPVVERFHQLFPRHRLQVQTGSSESLSEALRLGRIDIFAGAITNRTLHPGFAKRKLARSQTSVLAAPSHPLFGASGPVDAHDLVKYPFVAFVPSTDVLTALSTYLKDRGAPPPTIVLDVNSIYACIALARTGRFLFFETKMLAGSPIGQDLEVVELPGLQSDFDLGIIYRDGLDGLSAYRSLMRIMRDELAKMLRADR